MNTEAPFEDPFDEVIAQKLAEITPPEGLRVRLLKQQSADAAVPIEATAGAWWSRGGTAIAAAVALALVVAAIYLGDRSANDGGDSVAAAGADFAEFFESGLTLDLMTEDLPEVRAWYAARNDGVGFELPSALEGLPPVGCREIEWRGHLGALICFRLKDGQLAHMVVMPREAFTDPPESERRVSRVGDWEQEVWSEGGSTYLLYAPVGAKAAI
ncbi:MAG: hypothetical protein WA771_13570 [Chthoniobacterales bacterium]